MLRYPANINRLGYEADGTLQEISLLAERCPLVRDMGTTHSQSGWIPPERVADDQVSAALTKTHGLAALCSIGGTGLVAQGFFLLPGEQNI